MLVFFLAVMQSIGHPTDVSSVAEYSSIPEALIAQAIWDNEAPEPGQLAKLRVRGNALIELQTADSAWYLLANGEFVPSEVVWPEILNEPENVDLKLLKQSFNSDGSLVAICDRGLNPKPIDTLSLELSSLDLLSKATVYASNDNIAFTSCSDTQIVYQCINDGNIIRLSTVTCSPGNNRYLKFVIANAKGSQLTSVIGWNANSKQIDMYEVPVSFGAPISDYDTGLPLFPLEFINDNLPFRMFQLSNEEKSTPYLIRVVRLSAGGDVIRTPIETVICTNLTQGDVSRSQDKLLFQDSVIDGATWALSPVTDNINEFDSIRAWAAEVYIVFVMPESEEIALVFHKSGIDNATKEDIDYELDIENISAIGMFNTLTMYPYTSTIETGLVDSLLLQTKKQTNKWKYVLLLGVPGLLITIAGLALLKRPRERV